MKFGKRGMSHLELIVSILIFIFAVVFVIYFINFQPTTSVSESLLDSLEIGLRKEAEIDFNQISLFIDTNIGNGCFSISKHSILEEDVLTFIKRDNEAVAFNFSDDRLLILNMEENLYIIYSFPVNVTENLRLENQQCIELVERKDYNYSIVYREKIFTEKNLSQIKEKYYDSDDYKELKEKFGLNNNDFSIIVKNEQLSEQLNIEMVRPVLSKVEVHAKEFFAEVIKEDGTIINAKINIQVW